MPRPDVALHLEGQRIDLHGTVTLPVRAHRAGTSGQGGLLLER